MNDGQSRARAHALVICARRYNGHELWVLLGGLQIAACTFEVVSTEIIIKDELTFKPNVTKRTVYEVASAEVESDFDAVCVVSGNMADTEAYWTDKHVQELLRVGREKDKVIAAICCSVPTIAAVSKGVLVSYFPLVRSRHRLERYGAISNPVSLSVDQRTVTAENQMLSEMWAEEIVNLMHNKSAKPLYRFTKSNFTPRGGERMMPKPVRLAIEQDKWSKEETTE